MGKVKTVHQRIEDCKKQLKKILQKHGNSVDAVYESEDAGKYNRIFKKMRAYQVLASGSKKNV